ncbi:hypothetical protein SAMN05443572_10630 [Myxococcus fulvus]|uniref:Lipoprotein n=1 Tax=Myxococcus fulvus TaxID=33 RepID=A0A511TH07_MYXFU|nr:hypothetical protein [Myxococcus fulvus]GEN13457.1 hypothetical protein MFU01_84940 [Myxococcus fulvus]SEU19597.1 hypothetical protein SAMN05443572_10630 [Myxococcus fulvus]
MKRLPVCLVLLPLLVTLLAGRSRAAGLEVRSLTVTPKPEAESPFPAGDLQMPWVTHEKPEVAALINDGLFIARFKALAPTKVGARLPPDGLDLAGLSEQGFSVTRNDARLLTVRFDAEGCGAYCESYIVAYSFDVRTGRQLNPRELFTPAGVRALVLRMHKEKLRLYREQVSRHERELKTASKKEPASDTLADLEERIAFNRECLEGEEAKAEEERSRSSFHERWEFNGTEALMTSERCSNHASRALDDVGNVSLPLSYDSLRPQLTAYGKHVLLGEGQGVSGDVFGQVLRGRLGKLPIVMMLERQDDGSVSGVYFYEKHRKPIELFGKVEGGKLELQERDAEGNPAASLRLEVGKNLLRGDWVGKQTLRMELRAPSPQG